MIPNILFKGIELDQFLTVLQKWEKARHGSDRSNFDVAFKDVVENYYSKALDKKMETTQQIFSDSYFKKVTTEALQNMESHFSIQTLPLEAKETLKAIQQQYDNISTYQLKLSEEDKFTMQNLLEKRIPEVLEKFLTIPPDYRTGLTNSEGKNAQDLMLESLNNFNTKITSIVENIAQSKIQDLSVTKRYSKSI